MRTLVVVLILLFAFVLLLRLSEKKFIYFPSRYPTGNWKPLVHGSAPEDLFFTTADGVRLHGWFVGRPDAVASLLWCHGNAGNITDRLDNLQRLARLPLNILLFDYRGYGRSEGRPDEEGLYLDAVAAYDALASRPLVDSDRIFLFGRSLGGAVAAELATRRAAAGLILESTLTSAAAMAWRMFRPLPLHWVIKSRFDTMRCLQQLTLPILVIHGTQDEVIPLEMGKELFAAATNPKRFYEIAGAGHNDTHMVGGDRYFDELRRFVANTQ